MKILIIALLLFASASCIAGEHSDAPSGSAIDVGAGVNEELAMYEKAMQKTLNKIGALLKQDCDWCTNDGNEYKDLLKNIKENQAAWKAYAEAECKLLYKLEGPAWNSWSSTRWSRCDAGQAYTRLRQLKRVERCLASKNKGEKPYYFQSCIYQLAPLSLQ